jgi:hypothetical protein
VKRILLILFILAPLCKLHGQDTALAKMTPGYFISTDFVYDVVSIPTINYERFFIKKHRLRSLQADLGYQVHYSNQFGIATSHGDKVTIGVYEGPAAKIGYSVYTHKRTRRWSNYYSPALGLKYLWYNNIQDNIGKKLSGAYRIQSEQCAAAIPQFSVGAKRANKHFCADFYVGLQLPVKFRDKTISSETNAQGVPNMNVPYNSNVMTITPAPLAGIRLGYLNKRRG